MLVSSQFKQLQLSRLPIPILYVQNTRYLFVVVAVHGGSLSEVCDCQRNVSLVTSTQTEPLPEHKSYQTDL